MKYLERAAYVILFIPLALIALITFVSSLVGCSWTGIHFPDQRTGIGR